MLRRVGVITILLAMIAAAGCLMPVALMLFAIHRDTSASASAVAMATIRTAGITLLGGGLSMVIGLAAALYIYFILPSRWHAAADTALYCLAGISPAVFAMLTLILWQGKALSVVALLFAVMLYTCGFSTRYALKAFRNVPPALLDSARALGLTGLQSMRRVLIPSARRDLTGTALHTMARIGALAMILDLVGRGQYLTDMLMAGDSGHTGSAMLLAALCLGCYIAGNRIIRRRDHA